MQLFSRGFMRRRAISLATSLSVMATSFALAQDPKRGPEASKAKDTDERQFLFATDFAMSNITRNMTVRPSGDVDRDFANAIVLNHQGAIDMARAEIRYGHNDAFRQLAQRIVRQQEQEISFLRRALPDAAALMPSTGAEIASHAPN